MEKTTVRGIALLLMAVMVLASFAACTKKDNGSVPVTPVGTATPEPTAEPTLTAEPTPESVEEGDVTALYGTWEGAYDLAGAFNKSIEEDETGMFSGLTFTDVAVTMYLTFNEDGTFEFIPDEESYKAAMEQIVTQMVPVLKEFVVAMYSAFAEEGEEVTEEDILEAMEVESWDEVGEQMLEEINSEEQNGLDVKGTYELDGNTLKLNDNLITISLSRTELVFESLVDGEEFEAAMFPITFSKVN